MMRHRDFVPFVVDWQMPGAGQEPLGMRRFVEKLSKWSSGRLLPFTML